MCWFVLVMHLPPVYVDGQTRCTVKRNAAQTGHDRLAADKKKVVVAFAADYTTAITAVAFFVVKIRPTHNPGI